MITHALSFADEAAAKAALPDYWDTTDNGWDWRRDCVDGPIPTTHKTGPAARVPDATYNLNIALPELHTDLPGLVAAWNTVDRATGRAHLVHGIGPVTPQRVFA
jgi:hypothetical protein